MRFYDEGQHAYRQKSKSEFPERNLLRLPQTGHQRQPYVVRLSGYLVHSGHLSTNVFSYLINFVQNTLELGDNFVVPLAVVIIGAAVFTGVMGVLFDKLGRKHFYLPLLTVIVACTLIVYLMEFMPKVAWLPVLYVAGIFMLGSILSLSAALMASFQDYIPTGTEGRFQGVRMCFNVLLPMIIGPLITLIIGLSDVDTSAAGFTPPFKSSLRRRSLRYLRSCLCIS